MRFQRLRTADRDSYQALTEPSGHVLDRQNTSRLALTTSLVADVVRSYSIKTLADDVESSREELQTFSNNTTNTRAITREANIE